MRLTEWIRSLPRRQPSRIGLRLFAFNLLVVFVPVAGILYLDVYESRLLETQERGMIQLARLVAASIEGDTIAPDRVSATFARLEDRGDSRIRVYDAQGALVADSALVPVRVQASSQPDAYSQVENARRRVLYKLGAGLVRVRNRAAGAIRALIDSTRGRPEVDPTPAGVLPEVRVALTGRYGAASRQSAGQRSLTLSSAVPVRSGPRVLGAVVVSQSTFRILQALYDVRLRLFEIVLLSLAVATALTWIASSTIVNPILRLKEGAAALTSRRGGLGGVFSQVKRKDEIGDLARSLELLASRLDAHIKLLESFAADVAHEFRNPLTAIRTAAETVADADSADERRRFLTMLLKDVDRLEKLVSGVRELASIDTQLSTAERPRVDLSDLLKTLVAGRDSGVATSLAVPSKAILVLGSSDRLWQVFENLVDNAVGFSPSGGDVEITAAIQGSECVVIVADRGPGIPEAHLSRVFERFFSYRPGSDRREHMGLGLAIAQTVVAGTAASSPSATALVAARVRGPAAARSRPLGRRGGAVGSGAREGGGQAPRAARVSSCRLHLITEPRMWWLRFAYRRLWILCAAALVAACSGSPTGPTRDSLTILSAEPVTGTVLSAGSAVTFTYRVSAAVASRTEVVLVVVVDKSSAFSEQSAVQSVSRGTRMLTLSHTYNIPPGAKRIDVLVMMGEPDFPSAMRAYEVQ